MPCHACMHSNLHACMHNAKIATWALVSSTPLPDNAKTATGPQTPPSRPTLQLPPVDAPLSPSISITSHYIIFSHDIACTSLITPPTHLTVCRRNARSPSNKKNGHFALSCSISRRRASPYRNNERLKFEGGCRSADGRNAKPGSAGERPARR